MNFLIWKAHPLTTPCSLSFVHVEDPAGKASYYKTKEASSLELVSLYGTPSDYRTFYRAMLSVYEFAKWLEVYD